LNPSGPLTDIGATLANIDSFTGQKLIKPGDTARDKASVLMKSLAKLTLPSAATFHAPRVIGDLRRGDMSAARTDALGFVGARPSFVRPGMQAMRERRQQDEAVATIRADLRAELRKTKTPAAQQRAVARAKRRLEAIGRKVKPPSLNEP
jgi:hypothetical protein